MVLGWGTSLTLVDKTIFFVNLWFEGEARASPLLKIYIFLYLSLYGEAQTSSLLTIFFFKSYGF